MSKLAIVAAILPAAAWWWTNPSLLRPQYLNQMRMRSIIPVPTAKHGPTRLIRLSQCLLRTNAISGLMANRGARNDKAHCTITESRWIIASSRVEPQNK